MEWNPSARAGLRSVLFVFSLSTFQVSVASSWHLQSIKSSDWPDAQHHWTFTYTIQEFKILFSLPPNTPSDRRPGANLTFKENKVCLWEQEDCADEKQVHTCRVLSACSKQKKGFGGHVTCVMRVKGLEERSSFRY